MAKRYDRIRAKIFNVRKMQLETQHERLGSRGVPILLYFITLTRKC
jgi:hypothetical protein